MSREHAHEDEHDHKEDRHREHDHEYSHYEHDEDHDEHEHEEHDDDHEHDDLHLELHRAVDELGKYAIEMQITSKKGVSKDIIKELIKEAMFESTMNCLRNGADLIGHTKSFLICGEGSIMSSLVDEMRPVKIKDSIDADTIHDAKFILHVIVHGIWDDKVRDLTLEVLPGIFKKYDIPYDIIADYYDLERSIAHHQ